MSLQSLYQQKIIKNYQNFLANDLKDQCIGINIKQKVTIKIQQVNKDIFVSKNFVYRLFVLVYSNQDNNAKRFKSQRYFLSKGLIKNYNVIINGNNMKK